MMKYTRENAASITDLACLGRAHLETHPHDHQSRTADDASEVNLLAATTNTSAH